VGECTTPYYDGSVSRPVTSRLPTWRRHSCLPAPRLFSARASPARLTHAPHALARVSVTDYTIRQPSVAVLACDFDFRQAKPPAHYYGLKLAARWGRHSAKASGPRPAF